MIEINNLTTNEIDEKFIKRVAEIVLIGENIKEGELSIVFVGAGRMRTLNKKYRKKNKVTDVLSFGNPNSINSPNSPNFPKNQLGEIVICLQEIKKNVKRLSLDYKKELARVLIHGILHLLGYDHEKDEREAKEMEKRQKFILFYHLYFSLRFVCLLRPAYLLAIFLGLFSLKNKFMVRRAG